MAQDWHELSSMTGGEDLLVERVRLVKRGTVVEGQFHLPPLANLTAEDQVFVAAFVRRHGSIKEMEKLFGVSYPTVKNRLNRIAKQLSLVGVRSAPPRNEILSQLERGKITVAEAVAMLKR